MAPNLKDVIRSFRGQVVGVEIKLETGPMTVISVHTPARTIPPSARSEDVIEEVKLKFNPHVWRADVIYGAVRHIPATGKRFIVGDD